jgi:hypothetical protein
VVLIACATLLTYACVAPRPLPRPAPKPAPALPPPAAGAGDFIETFESPTAFATRFKTQVLHGVKPPTISSWLGDHDVHCGPPTTTRTIRAAAPAESFYWCAPNGSGSGHIMTSMNSSGYAQVDFSPNRSFTKIKRVCWDQNLTELGGRKWNQVVVVPESIYQANGGRIDYIKPPLQNDVAVGGVRISGETFMFEMLRGSTVTYVGQSISDFDFAGFTTPDKAQRFRHCITDLENGTVRIQLGRPNGVTDTRTLSGSFPNGPARVIFQDDTYDAPKDSTPRPANPFTWHWDNILIDV